MVVTWLSLLCRCEDAEMYERHVCKNECMSWKPLPQSQWQAHSGDNCQICQEPRFMHHALPSGLVKLKPHKVPWAAFAYAYCLKANFCLI